jgi:zinc ribbon protein
VFFVIFGLRARNKDRGPALRWVCSKCQNDVDLHFVTRRAWGTFFFVPVVPLTGEHYLVCPTCSNWFEMTPEQVEMARAVIKRARSSVGGSDAESECTGASAELGEAIRSGHLAELHDTWQPDILTRVMAAYERSGIESSDPGPLLDAACAMVGKGESPDEAIQRAAAGHL